MPRIARAAPGGQVYHVLNRGNGRKRLFHEAADYAAFEDLLFEVAETVPARILAWCLMPNHWHLVLWPRAGGRAALELHAAADDRPRPPAPRPLPHVGRRAPVPGARYKSLPVQDDHHF